MNIVKAPWRARWTMAAVAVSAAAVGLAVALTGSATSAGGTSPEAQRLLAEKARLLQKPAHVAPPIAVKPKPADVRPAPTTPAKPEYGIRTDAEAPAPSAVFRAVNRWQGELDGRRYTVYAGWAGQDRSLGRIFVLAKDAAGLRTEATSPPGAGIGCNLLPG